MITITRRHARRLRGIFRRSVLGITHRGLIAPLVLRAEGTQVRAQHRYKALAVEHLETGSVLPEEAICLPLDALADFEGRDASPVVLEAAAPNRTVVRWEDHGIPQTREYEVTPLESVAAFPDAPTAWTNGPPELLTALAEASATTAQDCTRYALNHVQLKGDTGEVAATDGRQLLIQSGFRFPWKENLLVPHSPIFASRELPHDQPVALGRTETHAVLRIGSWTLLLEIYAEGRFPVLGNVISDVQAATARLHLDPEDAQFLVSALDRIPGLEVLNAPATVDLNGRIAVRARGADQPQVTELVLSRSTYTGTPILWNSNREFLSRAIRLGFTEVEIIDAASPIVCRDAQRRYAWQPLDVDSVIAPTDAVIRIESNPASAGIPVLEEETPKVRSPVSEHNMPSKDPVHDNGATNNREATEPCTPTGLAALIQEAEALSDALFDARTRAGRLTVALRRYRKRERLVATTLASLKELKLQDAVE